MQTKAITLILAGLAVLPAAAYAKDTQRDATFCAAIGLAEEAARTCTQQLNNAASNRQHAALQATWVSKSPTMDRASPFYSAGMDNNTMNGMPGTAYQGKVVHLSNRVSAQIHRAVAAAERAQVAKAQEQAAKAQEMALLRDTDN